MRLTTASPLDDALAGQIVEKLRGLVGGEPILQPRSIPT